MNELVKKIETTFTEMLADMSRAVNGNKAAGARSRKASLAFEKLLKEYRKTSIEAAKK